MEPITRWEHLPQQGGMRPYTFGRFVLYNDYVLEVAKLQKKVAGLEKQLLADSALLQEGQEIVNEQAKVIKNQEKLLKEKK